MRDTMNDDIIREKLNQYESPVSTRNWDVIAEALKKKKRRRYFFWWQTLLPALLLIVAGISAYIWLRPADKNDQPKQENSTIVNAGIINNATGNNVSKRNNSSSTNSISHENTTNNNIATTDDNRKNIATKDLTSIDHTAINKAINNTNSDHLPAATSNNSNNNIAITNRNNKSSSNNSDVAQKINNVKGKTEWTDKANTELSHTRVPNTTSNHSTRFKQNAKSDVQLSDDENTFNTTINKISLFAKKKKKGKQNNGISTNDLIRNEANEEDVPDAKNEAMSNSELSMQWALLKWKGFTLAPHLPPPIHYDRGRIQCPLMFSPRRNDWYLDVYASPNLTNRRLSNRNNQIALNKKDTSERSTLSFSAGINLAKNIGNSFILRTGINYSLTNEKFSYSRINSIKDIIIITVKKIPIAPGDTTYIYDTTHIQQIGTQFTKATNRYHSVDVPIIFGYETRGEDIRFNINAGLIFNITSIAKGKTLSVTDTVVDIRSSGYYKTNLGISIFGSVMMLKRVNDRLDLFAEPYYKQGLGNMATDKAFFKQTQSSYGLNLGIRFRFNGRQRR